MHTQLPTAPRPRRLRPAGSPKPSFVPGEPGFSFEELYRPAKLAELHGRFLAGVAAAHPELHGRWEAYRAKPESLAPLAESQLLIEFAPHVSAFVARLFGVEHEWEALKADHLGERPLFDFKKEFVHRRVLKKGAPNRPTADEFPTLDVQARLYFSLAAPEVLSAKDGERALADAVNRLVVLDKAFATGTVVEGGAESAALHALEAKLLATDEGKATFGPLLQGDGYSRLGNLLTLLDRWTYARLHHPEGKRQVFGWASHMVPKGLEFEHLVELQRPDAEIPEAMEGLPEHLRRRDGFKLTDRRHPLRLIQNEVDYCLYCHERGKDSCSTGFHAKEGGFKPNPLGIPLAGCPLDERISEAHVLKARGDSLAALAVVAIDNPMCPGTGHRICNDCMKACIFQKQQPVDIPQLETGTLTDVLALPWGFEIYGFLTRWNPLNVKRPHALPYTGKNVLVVGLGPAGYTLAHYLANEGFGVCAIDGLKIEPFSERLAGVQGKGFEPIHDFWHEVAQELDQRVLAGFGGVSEYGITVRWDKNFLTLLHLTLARREKLAIMGGIRFGGTLTLEDAWELGFHHVAIATGAGRPTIIGMKNNLIRGVRKASDFLMALQLTGAFKKDSIANLQVQLPAVVIGGGLTAIDTATELFAYYPVQVEKTLERYEALTAAHGEASFWQKVAPDELPVMKTFIEHGKAIRSERQRAAAAHEEPDFVPLVRKWGGVSLAYRKTLQDSPAYRLNHEEVTKSLEEGIRYLENLSPVEAVPGPNGAVTAVVFERQKKGEDGKWKASGEHISIPARTVCVAAGTSPNVTYNREFPGTFATDGKSEYFTPHEAVKAEDGSWNLIPVKVDPKAKEMAGFFTSYSKEGKLVSFYGDNHPAYFGNVVKAMASAKHGHTHVARLFAEEIANQRPEEQPVREAQWRTLRDRLELGLIARVKEVIRLTPTIVEIVVHAPYAARHFEPGQFYRLQNYEAHAPVVDGTPLVMEGLALTGAWQDKERGLLSTIVLEMGGSSRLCSMLKPGEPVVLMGPTGTPTHIPQNETVVLAGGGLGNAVLFSIGKALRAAGNRVLYFAAFRRKEDTYHLDDIEAATDQVVWSTDSGELVAPRRPQDLAFSGNVVQAMVGYAKGELGKREFDFKTVDRIIAIGSDRMMQAVREARHGVLQPFMKAEHKAIGSINSPMQCMLKEICAQCMQRHVDPQTGKERFVFSCYDQDQELDRVDFSHLRQRLLANDAQERLASAWLDHLLGQGKVERV